MKILNSQGYEFCTGKGLDIFALVAGVECRCGASAVNQNLGRFRVIGYSNRTMDQWIIEQDYSILGFLEGHDCSRLWKSVEFLASCFTSDPQSQVHSSHLCNNAGEMAGRAKSL